MARVAGVISASTLSGRILKVAGSMSTKAGNETRLHSRSDRGGECERGRYHLRARRQIEGSKRQGKRGGSGIAHHGPALAEQRGDLPFELTHVFAREGPAAQHTRTTASISSSPLTLRA